MIAEYLNVDHYRLARILPVGSDDSVIHAFSNSDWAGCQRRWVSTSGGVLHIGSWTVKHWSSTQKTIAASPAEAGLYDICRRLRCQRSEGREVVRARIRREPSDNHVGGRSSHHRP